MTTRISNVAAAAGLTALLSIVSLASAAERRGPDANGDGALDFSEMQSRRSDLTIEQFNAMDKDRNGLLSREEMQAARQQQMQARASEQFKKLDADGDGALSPQELSAPREERAAERFKQMDTDGNGKLSEAEMSAARETMRQNFRERRGSMRSGEHGPRGQGGGRTPPGAN